MSLEARPIDRVRAALEATGVVTEARELPASTHTAAEAASAIGCTLEQIAKSVVFRGRESGRPVLVIASGPTRIDPARVAEIVGERVKIADPAFVEAASGFPVGGVPPLAPADALATVIDDRLAAVEVVWAAAGTPNAVMRLRAAELLALAGPEARVAVVAVS
jgi:prolyl-tRNA editing enzyme YbaK/EbsC (Cys-tRNA(Pro) deacylase)